MTSVATSIRIRFDRNGKKENQKEIISSIRIKNSKRSLSREIIKIANNKYFAV